LSSDDYELDPDGDVRELVGPWVRDKHARLERYIQISSPTRRKWLSNGWGRASYIDLYSGPGKCRIKDTDEVLLGSSVVAWKKSVSRRVPFSDIFVGDLHPTICTAVDHRLKAEAAPVRVFEGAASKTVDEVIGQLDPGGLHLAFLDPYDLKSLPFDVIRKLANVSHMDIIIHFSLYDLSRNLRRYIEWPDSPLDTFAPQWRAHVDVDRPDDTVRATIFHYWRRLLKGLGMNITEAAELVEGPNSVPLYWLAFVARHDRALQFWEEIRHLKPNPQLGILKLSTD
jgi:three-Cys-motif partner protein